VFGCAYLIIALNEILMVPLDLMIFYDLSSTVNKMNIFYSTLNFYDLLEYICQFIFKNKSIFVDDCFFV
jgi:hypothetical protein